MFLGWYDDTKKKAASEKIEEGIERYVAKFGDKPNVCLVNEADTAAVKDLQVRVVDYVRPNHFWLGRDELGNAGPLAA